MNQIKFVLSATDFSYDARHALQRAVVLAATLEARLEVLHVLSAGPLEAVRRGFALPPGTEAKLVEDAQRMLEAHAAEAAAPMGIEPAIRIAVGDVQTEILSASEQADILTLGAHGSSRLREALLGTTATRLLGKCRRPILVVKRPPAGAYRRVLIPIDFSAASAGIVRLATTVAPQAEFAVVHAFDVPYQDKLWLAGVSQERIDAHRARIRQEAQERIAALIRDSGGEPHRFRSMVQQDDPAPLIVSKETELDADLIVMGKRDRTRTGELLLGSAARWVLSAAKCDVLLSHD